MNRSLWFNVLLSVATAQPAASSLHGSAEEQTRLHANCRRQSCSRVAPSDFPPARGAACQAMPA